MMRTTVSIPDDLASLARTEARRRGVSFSAIVRRSLKQHLCRDAGDKLPWQGMVTDPDFRARDFDAALAGRWSADIAGDR